MPDDATVSVAILGLCVFNDLALLTLWRASFHINRIRNHWILTSKQRGTDSAASSATMAKAPMSTLLER